MPIDARTLIAAVMLAAGAASAQPERAETPSPPPEPRVQGEAPAPAAPAERAGEESAGASAEPFVPSESISADAVVSFPADI